jgi:starvation-inducible outer membrane lipoprotein
MMKHTLMYGVVLGIFILLAGCASDPPGVRVYNQRLTKANVQIKISENTINQNDVFAGSTTSFQNISEGQCVATAVIQDEAVSPAMSFVATNDNRYTIVIVGGNPPTLRIDAESN